MISNKYKEFHKYLLLNHDRFDKQYKCEKWQIVVDKHQKWENKYLGVVENVYHRVPISEFANVITIMKDGDVFMDNFSGQEQKLLEIALEILELN